LQAAQLSTAAVALNRKAIREDLSVSSARGGKCPSAAGVTVHSPHPQPGKGFLQSQQQISLAESLGTSWGLFLCGGGFPWQSWEAAAQPISLAARKTACCCLLMMCSKQNSNWWMGFSPKNLKELHPPLDTLLSVRSTQSSAPRGSCFLCSCLLLV